MNLWAIVPDHMVLALGWTLLHFVWQGALVAGLLAVASRAFDRNASGPRYLLATGALLLMATLPVATFFKVSGDLAAQNAPAQASTQTWVAEWQSEPADETQTTVRAWAVDASAAESADPQIDAAIAPEPAAGHFDVFDSNGAQATIVIGDDGDATFRFESVTPPEPAVQSLWLATLGVATTASRMLLATVARGLQTGVPFWMPWLVALWGMGVSLLTLRLLGGWVITQRIKRAVLDDPTARLQQSVSRLAARMRVSRPVRVFRSALVEAPTVIGWLKPVILVPVSAIAGLSPAQLEALLAHELAHIRRHDYLVNLLQTVVETLLFYHPAVWWVSRVIRDERENCCDDLAVAACGDRVAYARALCELERLRLPAPAMAMAASGGSLLQRIQRLLHPAPRTSLVSRCGACLVVLGSLLLVTMVLAPAMSGARDRDAASRGLLPVLASFVAAPEAPEAPPAPRVAPAPVAEPAPGAWPATPAPEPGLPAPAPHVHPAPLDGWDGPAPLLQPTPSTPPTPEVAPAPEPAPFFVPRVAPALPRVPQLSPAPLPAPRATSRSTSVTVSAGTPVVVTGDWLTAGRMLVQATQSELERAVSHMMKKDLSVTATANAGNAWAWASADRDEARARKRAERTTIAREQQKALRDAKRQARALERNQKEIAAILGRRVDSDYVREMTEVLGDTPGSEELLTLYVTGVTPDYVREMSHALGEMEDIESIAGMKALGVTPEYVHEMRHALGDGLDAEDLVNLKVQGMTPDYVREMRSAVSPDLDSEEVLGLRSQGVTPDYVREITAATGQRYDAEELVALKIQGVTPGYAQEIMARTGEADAEVLIDFRAKNVSPKQLDAMKGLGVEPGAEGLVELMSHGISLGDAAQMRRLRGHDLSLDQLIALRDAGVTPEAVGAMNVLGYRSMSEDDLIRLAQAGLTVEQVAQYTSAFGRTLSADELELLQNNGVGVVYAGNMAHLAGAKYSVEDIVAFYQHGVPSAWISAVFATGYRQRDVEDLITMADRGVDSDLIGALVKSGHGSMEPDEIARFADLGINANCVSKFEKEAGRRLSADEIIARFTGDQEDCQKKSKQR